MVKKSKYLEDSVIKKIKNKKSKKKNQKEEYYLIHNNGGRSFIVVIKNYSLKVYKTIWDEDIYENINHTKLLKFKDYTNTRKDEDDIIYTNLEPIFIISEYKEIFVGNDVMPDNTYIKNKNFGKGNSILVYDGKDYYCISGASISKLDIKKIKGKVIGFISPIGGSDVSYPQMLTTTHIYSWSNYISEHKLPKNNSKMKILKLLFQAKNPFDIPKKYYNDIKTFDDYYNFPYFSAESKIKLKNTLLFVFGRGPIESATLFSIGTQKKDEYGSTWEVIKGYKDTYLWEEHKYYLIHNESDKNKNWNKGVKISFVVVNELKSLKVYKVIKEEKIKVEESYIKIHNELEFKNYKNDKNIKLIVNKEPIFTLSTFKNIYIGDDLIINKKKNKNWFFGEGNSILVFDGNDYYSIISNTISKLNTKKIKGNLSVSSRVPKNEPRLIVNNFISPIDKDGISRPIMFTNTHIYNFCNNDIFEYKIKDDKILEILLFMRENEPELLNDKILSESNKYISLNEYLINKYCSCNKSKIKLDKIVLSK